ncbi:metallophosphoesterase family protein [Companilactobacillus sp. FL22-1]|uniref:metallophosphoesterase family protein n=1 Tax=Companilactobacillus sp. FL22-1 TaxID=3373892 RepID=UPI003753ECF6
MSKLKIIQITDTHLTPQGAVDANNQKVSPYQKLDNIVQSIAKMPNKPDLIVITGDLIHEGNEQDYQRLAKIIQEYQDFLEVPFQVIMGNHDRSKAFFSGYLKSEPQGKYYYSITAGKTDLYFLDSKFHDYEQGYIGQQQLSWLEDNLMNSKHDAVIFLHHPIDGPAIHQMRYSILQDGEDLMRVVKDTSVKAIFSGHIHFETSFERDNILLHSADSSAYHINCDNDKIHYVYDATYYDVITIDDGNVGVETKCIYQSNEVISHVDVEDTEFVDEDVFN